MLRIGTAKVDITPPVGYRMQGHAARCKPSRTVHDPLFAKVLTLFDGHHRLALITLDVIHLLPEFYAAARRRIHMATGISPDSIVIACSHTHTGPFTRDDGDGYLPDYVSLLEKHLCGAVIQAVDQERTAHVGWASAPVNIGVINRRRATALGMDMQPNPRGPIDPNCGVLRFDDDAGHPQVILFQYACHPTTLSVEIDGISADYPGAAQRAIERAYPGVQAMFMNGCCGDVRPAVLDDQGMFRGGGFDDIERMGRRLAAHVCGLAEQAISIPTPRLAATMQAHSYALDRRLMVTTPKQLSRTGDELRQRDPAAAADIDQWCDHWRERLANGVDDFPNSIESDLQTLRIGNVTLLALPGDIMCSIALAIRRHIKGPLIVAGYAQGTIGYIPTRRAILQGGYETRTFLVKKLPAPFALTMDQQLIRAVAKLATGSSMR